MVGDWGTDEPHADPSGSQPVATVVISDAVPARPARFGCLAAAASIIASVAGQRHPRDKGLNGAQTRSAWAGAGQTM